MKRHEIPLTESKSAAERALWGEELMRQVENLDKVQLDLNQLNLDQLSQSSIEGKKSFIRYQPDIIRSEKPSYFFINVFILGSENANCVENGVSAKNSQTSINTAGVVEAIPQQPIVARVIQQPNPFKDINLKKTEVQLKVNFLFNFKL